MQLTKEQINDITQELRRLLSEHKIKHKSKRGHMAECLYLRGVNSVLGVLNGNSAGAVNLPPIMAMSIMAGRSILDEIKPTLVNENV